MNEGAAEYESRKREDCAGARVFARVCRRWLRLPSECVLAHARWCVSVQYLCVAIHLDYKKQEQSAAGSPLIS